MTVVGVVSDTHLYRADAALPRRLVDGLRAVGVARILHCGDHVSPAAVARLGEIAPVDAVVGNNDPDELVARFGWRRVVEIDGARVGLVHGHDGPGRTTPDRAFNAFAGEPVDVVCFGHSHQPHVERRGRVMLLNPGSPTDKRREPRYTFALLTLGDGEPRAEIVAYDDRSA